MPDDPDREVHIVAESIRGLEEEVEPLVRRDVPEAADHHGAGTDPELCSGDVTIGPVADLRRASRG